LVRCIRTLGNLLKAEVCSNVSFHAQSDYIEIGETDNRDEKFPAIIIRGPIIEEDYLFRTLDKKIIINEIAGTYTETPRPKVNDAVFKIIAIAEGDIEGMDTMSLLISFFGRNVSIDIPDTDEETTFTKYNILLTNPIKDSGNTNLSDLVRYEGEFIIEGLEFSTGEDAVGKIAKTINISVK
jgi:DNA polymerase III delta prime subunit